MRNKAHARGKPTKYIVMKIVMILSPKLFLSYYILIVIENNYILYCEKNRDTEVVVTLCRRLDVGTEKQSIADLFINSVHAIGV